MCEHTYIFIYAYHILFIRSSVDGYLGCFHALDIINTVTMSIRCHTAKVLYYYSVNNSYLTLCSSKDCSTPGSPVLHYLPEFSQIHDHWVGDVSNHLILSCSLLLLPSIFPSIKVFFNESALCIKWPKYWNFSFNISPSNEYPGLISFRIDWYLALIGCLWRLSG